MARRMADYEELKKIAEEVLEEHGGGGDSVTIEKTVTTNGTYIARNEPSPVEGKTVSGYSKVNVELPIGTKTITENGTYHASDDNVEGYGTIEVNVQGGGGGVMMPANSTFAYWNDTNLNLVPAQYLEDGIQSTTLSGSLFKETIVKNIDFTGYVIKSRRPVESINSTLDSMFVSCRATENPVDLSKIDFYGDEERYYFTSCNDMFYNTFTGTAAKGYINLKPFLQKVVNRYVGSRSDQMFRGGFRYNEIIDADVVKSGSRTILLGEGTFRDNWNVKTIKINDGLSMTSAYGYQFNSCYRLTALVIKHNYVVSIGSNCFTNCYHILGTTNATYNPTGAADGYIYVPDALVDQYKAATNWSAVADQIKPLSEYMGE